MPRVGSSQTLATDKKYMKVLSILLISISLFGCSNNQIKPNKEDISAIRQILERSFSEQKESHTRNYPEGTEWEYILETEKIFDAFWNPKNLKQYGDLEELSRDRYKKDEYLIVQTEYIVAIAEPHEWSVSSQELYYNYRYPSRHRRAIQCSVHTNDNFMSTVEIKGCKVLHLTHQLKSDLNSFLGDDFTDFGSPSIMTPAQASERSAKRLAAANTLVTIVPGHWGEGWHFISHPEVEAIIINRDLDQAIVSFRIGYEGGYSVMIKNENNWIITESILYWIE
ncbi:MAG: hypothetical protein DRP64_07395 [Verrucomicrobia bacterium]|nr:MAG: hypothetical protein DRP64_07395 [Verrucomicrobiota bacterium]